MLGAFKRMMTQPDRWADKFDPCPICRKKNCQAPIGRGEVILRGGYQVVRQYMVCCSCGIRALWHRRLDKEVWTLRRNGVSL